MLRVTNKLWKILSSKQKWMTLLIGLMMLVGAFMESISISLFLPLITAVTNENGWDSTWFSRIIINVFSIKTHRRYIIVLLVLLIIIFVLKNLYLMIEYYIQFSFIAKSRYSLQKDLMRSYIRKPYEFYMSANSGEIVRIVIGDTNQTFSLFTNVLSFFTEIIVSIVLGITILIMSPIIASGLFLVLFVELLIITKIIKPIMNRLGCRQRKENALANKWLLQAVNGIKNIKVSTTESYFENQYCSHANEVVDIDRKNQTLSNIPRLLIEAFTMAGVLLVILCMLLYGIELINIIPQLSAFVIAAVRMLPSINRVSNSMNQTPFLEGGLDNVLYTLEKEKGEERKKENTNNEKCGRMIFTKELIFNQITFYYPKTKKPIFTNASLAIAAGQSVGIIGTSGAGKTTAIDIILGLLFPDEGNVTVDGIDIRENLAAWHAILAYIPQNIFLLDDTIENNIIFGRDIEKNHREKISDVLKEAQLERFVSELPDGIDTEIGEQGIRLSGGQKQRIAIARALYTNPNILFLDEATSALDNETEEAIMEAIERLKGKKTLVIIAHRLSTISNCDIVYQVKDGKIIKAE